LSRLNRDLRPNFLSDVNVQIYFLKFLINFDQSDDTIVFYLKLGWT